MPTSVSRRTSTTTTTWRETDCQSNPPGCNPLGINYIDYGLAAKPQQVALGDPQRGAPQRGRDGVSTNRTPHNGFNITQFKGLFKAPTTRNVDRRPHPKFVKAYMHNGVFTSLELVVHFYNTRNLTTQPGEVIDFTKPNPYGGLVGTPLWPKPEVLENLQNAAGLTPAQAAAMGVAGNTPTNGQVGNLQSNTQGGGRRRQLPEDPQRRLHQAQPGYQPVRQSRQ